jgi:hypothetical protein
LPTPGRLPATNDVAARAHRIELTAGESVGERGTLRVSWRVQRSDGWVWAADWPGAVEQELAPRPGTVWERRILVELPAGTLVERTVSSPGPERTRDPLEYLRREVRAPARRVQRTLYRVTARGELRKQPPAQRA